MMRRYPATVVVVDALIYALFFALLSPLVVGFVRWFLRALSTP
jgi:hypothetical protein